MNFAIREGLRLIANEGLENVWYRHNSNAKKLWKGLESLGMELHVSEDYRLPTLTTVKIPPAVDGDGFRNHLLRNFGIEIGNGLGELSGKVWRIGLMGPLILCAKPYLTILQVHFLFLYQSFLKDDF